jgi:D-xylonolactonase
MTNQKLEVIADYACETGENPIWHAMERRIYWTDIPTGRLFRFDPVTRIHEQCYSGRPVGGFTIQADGSLLLFMDRGTIMVWRDSCLSQVIAEIDDERDSRFNDVIADPEGRVFCGTMSTPERKGRLYRLDCDGSIEVVLEGVGCSNGMAFSADLNHFYHTDSFANEINRFRYSPADGSLSERSSFCILPEGGGLPDGCTLDAEGNLWSALWGGAGIVRIDERGGVVEKIALPVPKVSSIAFGGDGLSDMYITTAGGNDKVTDGPLAGALFRFRSQYRGRPEYVSRVRL